MFKDRQSHIVDHQREAAAAALGSSQPPTASRPSRGRSGAASYPWAVHFTRRVTAHMGRDRKAATANWEACCHVMEDIEGAIRAFPYKIR